MFFLAIEFNIEPKDTIANKGDSVLLECSGKANGNIRWRGPDGLDIGIDTFRTQLSNGSLYISSIEENRGLTGTYQCILYMEGYGTIVSRTAKVTVSSTFKQINSKPVSSYYENKFFRYVSYLC